MTEVRGHFKGNGTWVSEHARRDPQRAAAERESYEAASAAYRSDEARSAEPSAVVDWDDEIGHLGIAEAMPPDENAAGFRKAEQWREQHRSGMYVVGPVLLEDGRHMVCKTDDDSPNPREARDDPEASFGTMAVMGEFSETLGDSDVSGDREDWWVPRRDDAPHESLPWMLAQMRGADDAATVVEGLPTWADINEAALAHGERTGGYAFPLYLRYGSEEQAVIHRPEPGSNIHVHGEPIGFALVARDEADSAEDAFKRMSYAVETMNNYRSGHATTISLAFFDDTATDGPSEVTRSESFSWGEISDNFSDLVDEVLASSD